jgi:NAD+ kinase
MKRIGLVVHPTREIDRAIASLREWAGARGIEVVQVQARDASRVVAPAGEVAACDLIVALGGDGTVLTALRSAMDSATPVLGVACGSLGALSAVKAPHLVEALDMFEAGSWSPRELHALVASVDGRRVAWAINDLVLVRRKGQLVVDVTVGGELYARMAGDGVVAATALGSSAYSMAAGGPVMVTGTHAYVITPLLMHGGSAPPLVVHSDVETVLEARPGYAGFDVEVDGHPQEIDGTRFELRLAETAATLVSIGDPGLGITALRHRGLVTDSPRVLARDARAPVSPPADG